jgi:hypothetical protein
LPPVVWCRLWQSNVTITMSRSVALLAVPVVLGLFVSCGYSLAGRGSYLPKHIQVVGIPPIVNKTTYVGLDQPITQKVHEEFIGRGKFHPVSGTEGAHAVLSAEIVSFVVRAVGLNAQRLANRYEFIVTLRATFTDVANKDKKDVLWSNDALTFKEEYELSVTGDINDINAATFVDQQRGAIDRMASDIARTLVTAITEAF